jgi:hypothetical protein
MPLSSPRAAPSPLQESEEGSDQVHVQVVQRLPVVELDLVGFPHVATATAEMRQVATAYRAGKSQGVTVGPTWRSR